MTEKFCTKCGKENKEENAFCFNCGNSLRVIKKSVNRVPKEKAKKSEPIIEEAEKVEMSEEEKSLLEKANKNSGDSLFALGVLGAILSPLVYSFDGLQSADFMIRVLLNIIFMIPLIYYGRYIKRDDLSNIQKLKKVYNGIFIYVILFCILAFIGGGFVGILYLVLLNYLYKGKKIVNGIVAGKDITDVKVGDAGNFFSLKVTKGFWLSMLALVALVVVVVLVFSIV